MNELVETGVNVCIFVFILIEFMYHLLFNYVQVLFSGFYLRDVTGVLENKIRNICVNSFTEHGKCQGV